MVNVYWDSLVCVQIGSLCFNCIVYFLDSLIFYIYFLDILSTMPSIRWVVDENSPPLYGLFYLVVSFVVQKRFSFTRSHFSIVGLKAWANEVLFRKFLPCVLWALPVFSSSSSVFQVSHWGLWSIWSWFFWMLIIDGPDAFFGMWTPSFPTIILRCWRFIFGFLMLFSLFVCLFVVVKYQMTIAAHSFGFSVLFHWQTCLFWWHCLAAFITMVL